MEGGTLAGERRQGHGRVRTSARRAYSPALGIPGRSQPSPTGKPAAAQSNTPLPYRVRYQPERPFRARRARCARRARKGRSGWYLTRYRQPSTEGGQDHPYHGPTVYSKPSDKEVLLGAGKPGSRPHHWQSTTVPGTERNAAGAPPSDPARNAFMSIA